MANLRTALFLMECLTFVNRTAVLLWVSVIVAEETINQNYFCVNSAFGIVPRAARWGGKAEPGE